MVIRAHGRHRCSPGRPVELGRTIFRPPSHRTWLGLPQASARLALCLHYLFTRRLVPFLPCLCPPSLLDRPSMRGMVGTILLIRNVFTLPFRLALTLTLGSILRRHLLSPVVLLLFAERKLHPHHPHNTTPLFGRCTFIYLRTLFHFSYLSWLWTILVSLHQPLVVVVI